jgi:NTE family protein
MNRYSSLAPAMSPRPHFLPPGGRIVAVILASFALAGCSTLKPWQNEALSADEIVRYDGRAQLFDPARVPEVLVVASFSGGGSRAAAFAHAVIGELDHATFLWAGRNTSLAREIDMVIGVSGGSVAAAHLAQHGVGDHLQRFEQDFLTVDFQSRLMRAVFLPAGLRRTSSPWFGRGNVLADELDNLLFRGATFGHLGELAHRPYLIVGATDLATGAEFDFTSDQMSLLGSSIDRVPLAFAVAASSSVPLLFSPLSVRNFRSDELTRTNENLAPQAKDSARVKLTKSELDAFATGGRRFVHLVDGGLSDNLGTRRITDYVAQVGGIGAVLHVLRAGKSGPDPLPQRIVFISVNSERQGPLPIDQRGEVPSMLEVANAMIYGGLGRVSRETSLLFSESVERWRQELRALGPAARDADIFAIEITLSGIEDRELRERVLAVPTAFRISADDRALLRRAAKVSVANSKELTRFVASMAER